MTEDAALTIAAIDAMSADEITRRLAAPPAERAAFIRVAAEAGVAAAQSVYGQMLLDGAGVAVDRRTAFGWFTRAAKQGDTMAINMVGRCYDLGWGVAVDKVEAARWFRVAADRGLDWGMYNFATALALGQGVAEDRVAALDWFRRAEAATGNAKAINFIGGFHEDGWVVDRDLAAAADYYLRAAEGGDFRGQFNHARMLGDAGRPEEAVFWLHKCRETATPAFIIKARLYLNDTKDARMREAAAIFCD